MRILKKTLCIIFILYIVILGGCDDTVSQNDTVKVAIMPGSTYHVLFSIISESTIEISLLNAPVVNVKDDDFNDRISKTQSISLSKTDASEINVLIKALTKSVNYKGDHPIISIGDNEVQACVGNKLYRSIYQSDYSASNLENVNTALLDLTYKLIELSPIEISFEAPKR